MALFVKKLLCCNEFTKNMKEHQSEIRLKVCRKSSAPDILPPPSSRNNRPQIPSKGTRATTATTLVTSQKETKRPIFVKLEAKKAGDQSVVNDDSFLENTKRRTCKDPRKTRSKIPKPKTGTVVPERFDKYCSKKVKVDPLMQCFHTCDSSKTNTICTKVVSCSIERKTPTTSPPKRSSSVKRKSLPSLPKVVSLTRAIPTIVSPTENGWKKTALAPSSKSTFRFVPTYFKPEKVQKHKLDADLATAIAISKVGTHRENVAETASLLSTGIGSYRNSVKIDRSPPNCS